MDHSSAINNHTAERYLLDELTTVERDAYEEHFFSCPDCAEEIMSASDFIDTAKQVVQKELRVESYRRATQSFSWGRWLNWRSILQPIPLAACTLVVTLAGLVGYQNLVTMPRLTEMASIEVTTEAPFPLHASRSAVPVLTIARHDSVTVPVEIVPTQGYTSYQVSVLSKSTGKILSTNMVSPEQAKKVHLQITAALLQPGRYDVLIEGVNGNKKEIFDRFPFELKLQD